MQLITSLLPLMAFLLPATVNSQGALVCGTTGWDVIGATPAYYALTNPTFSTPAACKKLCVGSASPKCGSFAVGNGTCLLYTGSASSVLNGNTASPYAYYDQACPL